MPHCCPDPTKTESTGAFFSKRSNWYARSFRKGKLEKIQQAVIDEICTSLPDGKTILDIGSGVGKLHLSLLQRGAASATGVDMSDAMIGHAKSFAAKFGVESKTTYLRGDFLTFADSLPTADITLLDKVICCYENVEELIRRSTEKTDNIYVLIYPADNFLVHLIFEAEIAVAALFRSQFRPYWHRWSEIPRLVGEQHFQLSSTRSTFLWRADIYKREPS